MVAPWAKNVQIHDNTFAGYCAQVGDHFVLEGGPFEGSSRFYNNNVTCQVPSLINGGADSSIDSNWWHIEIDNNTFDNSSSTTSWWFIFELYHTRAYIHDNIFIGSKTYSDGMLIGAFDAGVGSFASNSTGMQYVRVERNTFKNFLGECIDLSDYEATSTGTDKAFFEIDIWHNTMDNCSDGVHILKYDDDRTNDKEWDEIDIYGNVIMNGEGNAILFQAMETATLADDLPNIKNIRIRYNDFYNNVVDDVTDEEHCANEVVSDNIITDPGINPTTYVPISSNSNVVDAGNHALVPGLSYSGPEIDIGRYELEGIGGLMIIRVR
jgi:hypothetical protein